MNARARNVMRLVTALLVGAGSLGAGSCLGIGHRGFFAVGTAIDVLPGGFLTIHVGARPYYYHHGIFYRPYRGGYLIVPAPIGAVVTLPPPGYVVVMVENDPWAYYRGVFYAPQSRSWVVMHPPVGVFVRTIPDGAVSHRVGGVEYKEYAGVYYRPAVREGRRGYQVTEAPTVRR